jgi:hypothetical protein
MIPEHLPGIHFLPPEIDAEEQIDEKPNPGKKRHQKQIRLGFQRIFVLKKQPKEKKDDNTIVSGQDDC